MAASDEWHGLGTFDDVKSRLKRLWKLLNDKDGRSFREELDDGSEGAVWPTLLDIMMMTFKDRDSCLEKILSAIESTLGEEVSQQVSDRLIRIYVLGKGKAGGVLWEYASQQVTDLRCTTKALQEELALKRRWNNA